MSRTTLGIQAAVVAGGAFVVGLVAGGMGPRAEIRELQEQVFELERAKSRRSGGSSVGRDLTELLAGELDMPDGPSTVDREGDRILYQRSDDTDGDEIVLLDEGGAEPAAEPDGVDMLAAAREAVEARRAQAWAALREDVRPSNDQEVELQDALDDMNDQLFVLAEDVVRRYSGGVEPTRREAMALGSEVLDLLVETENRMLDTLTPEQRAMVRDEATDPTAFVDADVVETVLQLEAGDL